MRYEIDQTSKEVRVYDENDVEILYQPTWPDGSEWASLEEATAWVEQYLLSRTDSSSELAGPSPDKPTVARPPVLPLPVIPGTE
jgi:hypothetical protein